MQIQKTTENGVTVLNITGRLVSTTVAALESAIDAVLDEDNKLILDFSGVDSMASSGIRTLLVTSKRVKTADGLECKPCCYECSENNGIERLFGYPLIRAG
ncbi:MAG: STAS domain-containing protein [Alphaproteobacteria bacterium]